MSLGIPKELSNAATTASQSVSNVLTKVSAVGQGLVGLSSNAADLKSVAQNGLTNLGKNLLGNLPGLEILNGASSVSAGEPNLGKLFNSRSSETAVSDKPPFKNVLHDFASFTYHYTLSVLPDTHVNNPAGTYRKGDLGPIIIRSAGGAPESELISTAYGKYDFFIENLRLSTIVGLSEATGNSNAISFSFTVVEPYSMGLFFQLLQTAALQNNYANYLDVPLLLTIKFKGHVDPNNLNITLDNTTKMLPMKLRHLSMRVSGKGTSYDVEAYPWNEQAFADTFHLLRTDISLQPDDNLPKTVESLLKLSAKSLKNVINKNFKKQSDDNTTEFYDEIDIEFPPETNAIGKSGLGLNLFNKGDTPFGKDNFVYDEGTGIYKRGKITINPNLADYKFAQGGTIQDVINQVVLISDYGRQALDEAKRTPEGEITWWRIETYLYVKKPPEDAKLGQKPKKIVYRIVPYNVHASVFMPPNDKAPGVANMEKQSLKEYNYIYTGKNLDVLDFQIEFQAGFYKALNADSGKSAETHQSISQTTGMGAVEQKPNKQENPDGSKPPQVGNPVTQRYVKTESQTAKNGGTGIDDAATIAARQFHDLATHGADMINLNLTILGDPYYIVDSGVGNYTAGPTNYKFLNSDGCMDYQNGEVYITVNFRTPIDINNKTGFYDFGDTRPVTQFSGLYRVMQVDSTFNKGKFLQVLSLVRMVGQENQAKEGVVPIPKSIPQPQEETGPFENNVDYSTGAGEFGEEAPIPVGTATPGIDGDF